MQTQLEARHFGPSNDSSALSLPPFWTAHFDPNSGLSYYYNTQTGVTQWQPPKWENAQAVPMEGLSGPMPHPAASQESIHPVPNYMGNYCAQQPPLQLHPLQLPSALSQPTQPLRRKESSLPPIASGPLNKDYAAMARE